MTTEMIPVFDGHNDMLLRMCDEERFFRRNADGHVDLPRAREGRLGGGFCAVFVPSPREHHQDPTGSGPLGALPRGFPPAPTLEGALRATMGGMARLFRLEERSGSALKVVKTAADIEGCLQNRVFAALLHIEGAEAIGPDLAALEVFHRAGLRSIGPVWSRPNIFAEGVPFDFPAGPDTGPGLTNLGRELVGACNRLRVLVDLSHLNERGFWDVAAITDAPLVATHSNAWALSRSTRNLTDSQLDAIRESDGMVGINFCVGFLREDGAGDAQTPLEVVVRHVDYLAERLGIDRVGFGSDFDGARIPAELGDAAGLPRLIDALRTAGYDDEAVRKLAHGNWVRVLRKTWGE